uniref:Prokaryotic molybdopterin-containing oxidoreductase family, membrane subunit n=1 Tax=Candidatus Kentrum sp. SD TaxID=2126332 RepID=A0A451BNY1_9GAMM|nr:MAG: prokaryotic molybdopterin-containing oxidoreductase family, membrane subunit [Candidatus Kentron sp. SD]VFK46299.1 MAG: prokaryotic molybdopterin-containing oxidoreductase family, membrane subunit [Candidatus Kentron sp. SD]VFK79984.1 MAG: prokaryotic molybdopterin-containing oxidoreductase family, membrane subunit [Candidatus Kentron sp. SD]
MKVTDYVEIEGRSKGYWFLLFVLGGLISAGLGASYYMEHNGHWVTGMSNQVVWGIPHVFAVFLIVSASGTLNIASIASVFGKEVYKPLSRLSGILSIALLVGGLSVLVLDLGRPDRLIVAMTTYNFKSIFAWNIFLYVGFIVIVAIYLWMMMENRMNRYSRPIGILAFIWRLLLTTGTGSIFGFLVARQAFDAAIMGPLFVVMSFSYGLAFFILVLMWVYHASGWTLGDAILIRLKGLLGVFVAATLYFTLVYHLTNLYATEHHGVESFILAGGNIYTYVFWFGMITLGAVVPLLIFYMPVTSRSKFWIAIGSGLVMLGGFAQIFVIIIGGQAYPLVVFPGKEVQSGFFDGMVGSYAPSYPELILGVAGVAIGLFLITVALKIFRFLPASLADEAVFTEIQK